MKLGLTLAKGIVNKVLRPPSGRMSLGFRYLGPTESFAAAPLLLTWSVISSLEPKTPRANTSHCNLLYNHRVAP